MIPLARLGGGRPENPFLPSNYRMKLTRLGHRFSSGIDTRSAACSLARARLGLQLMRGR